MCPGIDPARMGFWEFIARRAEWADRHPPAEGAEVAAPSPDKVERMFAKTRLN